MRLLLKFEVMGLELGNGVSNYLKFAFIKQQKLMWQSDLFGRAEAFRRFEKESFIVWPGPRRLGKPARDFHILEGGLFIKGQPVSNVTRNTLSSQCLNEAIARYPTKCVRIISYHEEVVSPLSDPVIFLQRLNSTDIA